MRIIHILNYFQPKVGYQETFLAKEHAKSGHEVYVVTSDRYSSSLYAVNTLKPVTGGGIKGAGFFIEEGIKVWRLKTLFELPYQVWMLKLESKIQELKPDIVIMHDIVNLTALRIARLKKKLGNFKLIYDDHMTFGLSTSKLRILYPLFKWTFSRLIQETADALVAILPETKMFIHERYGIPLERIAVIPLGADDTLFKLDVLSRQEARNKLSLNETDIVFIYTGKIYPGKRLGLLIRAMKLMGNYNDLKVLLVGNGPQTYIEELKQNIKAENLEDRFIWHDAVPNKELYKFYSAADVAIWPHGPSISMREAMACSLPIIISEGSAVTELVDYNNGLICQEENASDLSQQMEKLLDPQLRREMGQRSRKLVEEKFSWRIIARQFIELVETPCGPRETNQR